MVCEQVKARLGRYLLVSALASASFHSRIHENFITPETSDSAMSYAWGTQECDKPCGGHRTSLQGLRCTVRQEGMLYMPIPLRTLVASPAPALVSHQGRY